MSFEGANFDLGDNEVSSFGASGLSMSEVRNDDDRDSAFEDYIYEISF